MSTGRIIVVFLDESFHIKKELIDAIIKTERSMESIAIVSGGQKDSGIQLSKHVDHELHEISVEVFINEHSETDVKYSLIHLFDFDYGKTQTAAIILHRFIRELTEQIKYVKVCSGCKRICKKELDDLDYCTKCIEFLFSGTLIESHDNCCVCLDPLDSFVRRMCHNNHFMHVHCARDFILSDDLKCPLCKNQRFMFNFQIENYKE